MATENHGIYQNKKVEPVEPVRMNICQRNTYRNDLSRLHFDSEPRIYEKQQVKGQQSYIPVFVTYLTFQLAAMSISSDFTVFDARPFDRFIQMQKNLRGKKVHRANQSSNFLGESFSNKGNVEATIQFSRERQT